MILGVCKKIVNSELIAYYDRYSAVSICPAKAVLGSKDQADGQRGVEKVIVIDPATRWHISREDRKIGALKAGTEYHGLDQ
jgi:hypothetical protein